MPHNTVKSWAEGKAEEFIELESARTILHPTSTTSVCFPTHERKIWIHGIEKGHAQGVGDVVRWAADNATWEVDGLSGEDYQVVKLADLRALLEGKKGREAEWAIDCRQ